MMYTLFHYICKNFNKKLKISVNFFKFYSQTRVCEFKMKNFSDGFPSHLASLKWCSNRFSNSGQTGGFIGGVQ